MLDYIEFNNNEFEEGYNNLGGELTNNTIILCDSYETMNTLHKYIIDVVNEEDSENINDVSVNYYCEDEDVRQAKTTLCFGLQRVVQINNQTITLALEPSIMYKAEEMYDIWFVEKYDKYRICAMSRFKGSVDKWNEGKDAIYKYVVNGRYGCYDGKWFDFGESRLVLKDNKLTGMENGRTTA
jgi:hypothetical protein